MSSWLSLTGGSRVTDEATIDFSEVFADTSVLIDFTLQQDDGSSEEVLKDHPSENYVGDTAEREYRKLKERRMTILESIYAIDDLSNWEPPGSVRMSDNDRSWCAELLAELDQMADRDEIERRLSLEERRFNRGWELLFDEPDALIEEVLPGERNVQLLGYLNFVGKENDRKVICECAEWSADDGTGNLITADRVDMLDQRERIEETVERNPDVNDIRLFSAPEFLDEDPSYP